MHIEYHDYYSYRLGRMMPFKCYGHAGKPLIVFPSSGGRFHEYEDFGMIGAMAWFIEQGLIRVYTPDSIDAETWLNHGRWASDKAKHHNAYDAYIVEEFVPYIRQHSGWPYSMMVTGCSMGGYHSANFFFRHPDVFDTVIALSGLYDARFFVGENVSDHDVYLNSPIDYLKNISDEHYLHHYRQNNIIICTGQGDFEADSIRDTQHLQSVLESKGIPAWIDYWGYDVKHDWEWWRVQMPYYLGKLKEQGKL